MVVVKLVDIVKKIKMILRTKDPYKMKLLVIVFCRVYTHTQNHTHNLTHTYIYIHNTHFEGHIHTYTYR